jgi:hypothetical protein
VENGNLLIAVAREERDSSETFLQRSVKLRVTGLVSLVLLSVIKKEHSVLKTGYLLGILYCII